MKSDEINPLATVYFEAENNVIQAASKSACRDDPESARAPAMACYACAPIQHHSSRTPRNV